MELYTQYCDAMYSVALRYVKNEDDAEDVVQEAFIKAFRKLDQYRAEVAFGAWLKRIVINKSIDFLKTREDDLVAMNESYLRISSEDEDWSLDEGIAAQEVKRVIEQLPVKYGNVLKLFLIEGYDHAEIAEIMDVTNSVTVHFYSRKKQSKGSFKKQKKCHKILENFLERKLKTLLNCQ